jgi:hypothetical protein
VPCLRASNLFFVPLVTGRRAARPWCSGRA